MVLSNGNFMEIVTEEVTVHGNNGINLFPTDFLLLLQYKK